MAPNPEDRLGTTSGPEIADRLEFEPVTSRPKPKRHWGRWVSFAVVIVVGAGGGWYYFGDRLPMGQEKSVPLIQADITPVKIKPADPGGMEIPDRDKLVYDRLKGEGAGTTVERLLPPPEVPIAIPDNQLQDTVSEIPAVPQSLVPESGTTTMDNTNTAALSNTASQMPETENAPVPLQPVTEAAPAPPETTTPEVAPAEVAPPPPPAPVEPVETAATLSQPTALEPPAPSAPTEPVVTQTLQETVTQTAVASTTTDTTVTKEYRIQLAALRSHERAEAEWKRQKKAHPDILGKLTLFVVRVDLGEDKGVFFRLRAGPLKDAASAKALCNELAKRNVGCLVIRPGK